MAGKRTIFNLKAPQLKSSVWLLFLAVAGVALILLGSLVGRTGRQPSGNALAVSDTVDVAAPLRQSTGGNATLSALERELAGELERILSRVTGAGRVTASVSLTASPRLEYSANVQTTERTTEETDKQGGTRTISEKTVNSQPVILRGSGAGDDQLSVVSTRRAEISGVLVVSEGAGDSRVRDQLTRACMTLLDLPAHRIKVVQGKVGE